MEVIQTENVPQWLISLSHAQSFQISIVIIVYLIEIVIVIVALSTLKPTT